MMRLHLDDRIDVEPVPRDRALAYRRTMFEGVAAGVLAGAVVLGFRHGIDWDHLAALADLTGAGTSRRHRVLLATMYALGHAGVVLGLGLVAIVLGASLPAGIDTVMQRIVGATLVALGVWVVVALVRQRRAFRLRSRWMLVSDGIARGVARLRRDRTVVIEHEHEHTHDGLDHAEHHGHHHERPAAEHQHEHEHEHAAAGEHLAAVPHAVDPRRAVAGRPAGTSGNHRHRHRHVGVLRDPFDAPSLRVAAAIGCVHGIGAETPTQLVLLTTAAGAQGGAAGVAFLAAFVVGLVASNTTVATAMAVGRIDPERSFPLYAGLSLTIAVFSVAAGVAFLVGGAGALPSISGS